VHNGLLRLGGDKMSKSLGNLVSVEEALERFSPDAIRIYFLSSHYRSPLSYTDDGCASMERSLERLRHALDRDGASSGEALDAESYQHQFFEAMDDDLNTPRALAALFDLARDINRSSDAGRPVADAQDSLRHLGGILGLTFAERPQEDGGTNNAGAGPFIDLLLETRTALRQARQFEQADRIRDSLEQLGVSVEDTPSGPVWQFRNP
jgi:cysteinyl-tRNA synthetase